MHRILRSANVRKWGSAAGVRRYPSHSIVFQQLNPLADERRERYARNIHAAVAYLHTRCQIILRARLRSSAAARANCVSACGASTRFLVAASATTDVRASGWCPNRRLDRNTGRDGRRVSRAEQVSRARWRYPLKVVVLDINPEAQSPSAWRWTVYSSTPQTHRDREGGQPPPRRWSRKVRREFPDETLVLNSWQTATLTLPWIPEPLALEILLGAFPRPCLCGRPRACDLHRPQNVRCRVPAYAGRLACASKRRWAPSTLLASERLPTRLQIAGCPTRHSDSCSTLPPNLARRAEPVASSNRRIARQALRATRQAPPPTARLPAAENAGPWC